MTLQPGTSIGPYDIVTLIGAGGMGEVYRARDRTLHRDVALKVLPTAFAADADRFARFEREARTLAALNHPNIAVIHGLERSGAVHALVMELVEGETLAERLLAGAGSGLRAQGSGLPIEEAVSIAKQIADALGAAHEQGIVHRDLKPANVKVRADGTVKVLDFGLAKVNSGAATPDPELAGLSQSPTITSPAMTEAGVILGTAAYMSPEQAMGHAVDKRSDIWAFGCVLYEMLTGRRAFGAPSVAQTIAAILERDVDSAKLPATTPPGVRRLLRRCLVKDARRRLHDIADARLELDEEAVEPAEPRPVDSRRSTGRWVAALVATAIVVAAGTWLVTRSPSRGGPEPAIVTRLFVEPEEPLSGSGENGQFVTLSPDGRLVAYVAGRDGQRQMFIHGLDEFQGKPMPGTRGATGIAFSPDGAWIAFVADNRIKKVSLDGGEPVDLCEVLEGGRDLSWESNDAILYSGGPVQGIWRVSAAGGIPSKVTSLGPGEVQHRYPQILPGGRAVIYSAGFPGAIDSRIVVQSLDTGERHEIASGDGARYLASGHLVYVLRGVLYATSFDPVRLEAKGTTTAVVQGVAEAFDGTPQIAFSRAGSMTYMPVSGERGQDALVWVDRTGREQPTGLAGPILRTPRLAPDLRRIALVVGSGSGPTANQVNLLEWDLERGSRRPLTLDGTGSFPVWSPDGARLAFNSRQSGVGIHVRTFGSSAPDGRLETNDDTNLPLSWSPDGRFLAGVSVNADTGNDVWVYSLDDPSASRPFVRTKAREGAPTFSHDGRWIAYSSLQSGRNEVYMGPFPGPGQEWTISTDGGNEPVWAKKSGQLFYRQGNAMMVVEITSTPEVAIGKPRRLFEGPYARSNGFWPNYDVTPDGQRFLMVKGSVQEAPRRINVIVNWAEELRRLVPGE